MKSLARQKFLDLTWDVADLDTVAEFWLRLYELAAPSRRFTTSPRHGIEIRLTGFPENAGEELRLELERRAAVSDLLHAGVRLRDPDTLVLSSKPEPGNAAPPAGLGLPTLAGPPFDGLAVELRFSAIGREGGFIKSGTATVTLVIIGELLNGELLVKAIWRSGSSRWEDDVYWSNAFPDEAALIAGFEQHKATGEVDTRLARRLFKESSQDHIDRLGMKLMYVPLGRPRLVPLLVRFVFFAILLAGFGYGVYCAIAFEMWLLLVAILVPGWFLAALLFGFVRIEARLLSSRSMIRADYSRYFDERACFAALSPSDAEVLLADPAVRKDTAEIRSAGFVHAADVANQTEDPDTIHRVFQSQDGVSYLILGCRRAMSWAGERFRMWPAAISFQAQTFFTSGGRVDSVQGEWYGFTRQPVGPDTLIRVEPEVTHPIVFLRSHAAATETFAREQGLTPKRHESIEDFIRRQQTIHEEEREWFRERPYSWRDHLRWYLQLPRWEHRPLA